MSEAPAPEKTIYQLHAEMRAAFARRSQAYAALSEAKEAERAAAHAAAEADAAADAAQQALIWAPGSMTDHLDALTVAVLHSPLDPYDTLRMVEKELRKGDEVAALRVGRLRVELECAHDMTRLRAARDAAGEKWVGDALRSALAWFDARLAEQQAKLDALPPAPAPPPAV